MEALQRFANNKILVFTATKRMADQLSRTLNHQGYSTQTFVRQFWRHSARSFCDWMETRFIFFQQRSLDGDVLTS